MTLLPQSKRVSTFLLASIVLVFSSLGDAAQLYRYKDQDGKTVLGRTIPPGLVGNGYEVLNEKGRVIESVAPALTPEQIRARDAELARQKKLEEQRARQAELDAELRLLYSHPDDAVRILQRKANDVLNVMQAKQNQIEFSNKQIVELEQKAADLQRKGMAVPERFEAQIKALKTDIDNANIDIEERSKSFDRLLAEFGGIVERLEVITNKKSTQFETVRAQLLELKQTIKIDK